MGKRRRAREMAIQMLYQQDQGGSSLDQIFSSFDLDAYRRAAAVAETGADRGDEIGAAAAAELRAPGAGPAVLAALEVEIEGAGGEQPAPAPMSEAQARRAFAQARKLVEGTVAHREDIDRLIRRHAENWRLERMPTIDRNILRLAVYEMEHQAGVPKVVVLDEAIELAKKFGSEDSGRFVNGLLDAVLHARHGEAVAAGGRR